MPKLTRLEFDKIYKLLPQDLKEILFSPEATENIILSCRLAEVPPDKIGEVSDLVRETLIGLLDPAELAREAMEILGIEEKKAKKLSHHLYRLIFAKVKNSLIEIYYHSEERQKPESDEKTEAKRGAGSAKTKKPEDPYREFPE